jgi:hypothetical protein
MAFNLFPYSNFHKLNLDWVLQQIKSALQQMTEISQTVGGYENRLSSVEQVNSRQDSTLTTHEQQISSLQQSDTTLGQRLDAVVQVNSRQDNTLATHEQRITANAGAINGLNTRKLDVVNGVAQGLTVTAAPTTPMGVANKAYVDEHSGSSMPHIYNVRQVNGVWQLDAETRLEDILDQLGSGYAVAIRLHIVNNYYLDLWTLDWEYTEPPYALRAIGIIGQADMYELLMFGDDPTTITVTRLRNVQMLPPTSGNQGQVPAVVGSGGRFTFQYATPVWPAIEVAVAEASAQIEPVDNHVYQAGTLSSLTVSNAPATGSWGIVFTSGSTATTVSGLTGILGLETFQPAVNTLYEINVLNNRAVVGAWEVSA